MSSIAPSTSPLGRSAPQFLIGRDLAKTPQPAARSRRVPVPGLILVILAALALAGLRVQILDLKLRLGKAQNEQQQLDDEVARLRVEVRELRDPRRLAHLATGLGLVEAARVVEIDRLTAALSTGQRR
jgi:cell division protein FtsL